MSNSGRRVAFVATVGLTAVIGAVDYLTGYELELFTFYFAPIAIASWYLGRTAGLVTSALSLIVWFLSDMLAGHVYSDWTYQYWNAALRFVAFYVFAVAVARIKLNVEEERSLNVELSRSLSRVKQLQGLLPICAWCKNIRNDAGYWEQVEVYIRNHSEADFTHGICPECQKKGTLNRPGPSASPPPGDNSAG